MFIQKHINNTCTLTFTYLTASKTNTLDMKNAFSPFRKKNTSYTNRLVTLLKLKEME